MGEDIEKEISFVHKEESEELFLGEDLSSMLGMMAPKKILVVGDFILDAYTKGQVQRISPEAPVPILRVEEENLLPGGAGNVVRNLACLGNETLLLGRIGSDDPVGKQLQAQLVSAGVSQKALAGLIKQKGYRTPRKNRLISGGQQLLRLDEETPFPLDEETLALAKEHLLTIIERVEIIAVSDYGKGFVTRELMELLVELAAPRQLKIIVDPKRKDFSHYEGAWLIKPNLREALAAANLPPEASLEEVGQSLLRSQPSLSHIIITRAKDGLNLFSKDQPRSIPFPIAPQEVIDVTGAGDCVLALAVFALCCNIPLADTCRLANIAGTLATRRLGCAALDLGDVAHEMLLTHRKNKVLHEQGSLFALRQIAQTKQLLLIDAGQVQSPHLLSFTNKLKNLLAQHESWVKVLYLSRALERVGREGLELLLMLPDLDFILLKEPCTRELKRRIEPSKIYRWEKSCFEEQEVLLEFVTTRDNSSRKWLDHGTSSSRSSA